MLNVKKTLTKILSTITLTTEVKEGVTIYRQGKFRMIHIDTGSAWCATLSQSDRPSDTASVIGKVYNGSSYVDCAITVGTNGRVEINNLYGQAISGAQYGYLRPRDILYYVGG